MLLHKPDLYKDATYFVLLIFKSFVLTYNCKGTTKYMYILKIPLES